MIRAAIFAFVLVFGQPSHAVECAAIEFEGARYTVCEVNSSSENLQLFLRDRDGNNYGQFGRIDEALAEQGQRLSFAMNAGMYHEDRSPVGHYLEDGQETMRVISNAGPGNFGLLPNGVLCLRPDRADVFETNDYLSQKPACDDATQSGPMLVIDGELHPRFLKDGTSVYVRNGVGTSDDGTRTVFAISEGPVNFYGFGRLFRDHLKVPNALYLDGNISRMFSRDLQRSDFGFSLGPIIGVVEPIE